MDGVDLVLMRSNSGNQILDIDFGSAEAALMGPTRDQLMGPASRVGPSHGHPQMHQQHHQQHSIYGGPGAGQFANVRSDPVNNLHGLSHFGAMPHMQPQIAMPSGQPMRKLKIVEHHVHRIDTHTKDNGDPEEELVVSNLRHFTLKVAVVDVNEMPILDTELPLQATLLYENGLPVKQLSNSEPLLVGEPEVVALQGSAVFKLRITSLSSHRDKQRFRIQIAPQSQMTRQHEPALTIVTDPMKSVTKLAHRSVPKEVNLFPLCSRCSFSSFSPFFLLRSR
ncbi:hypothetical protein T492DRAFT_430322 [Pavlovales sp. CCMP2436]|nr:hypothetical protein T492DRAFT_430322 [Pavlovales sp. CCMP2436]